MDTTAEDRSTFAEAVAQRRTYFSLNSKIQLSNDDVSELVKAAIKATPSSFGIQSTHALILFGEHHAALWDIAKASIRAVAATPSDAQRGMDRVERLFKPAAGTVCFFQDARAEPRLTAFIPNDEVFADSLPMRLDGDVAAAELSVWMTLRQAGIGCSLQHYNPIINEGVRTQFKIPKWWRMHAQIPFGGIAAEPSAKEYAPMEGRIRTANGPL